MWEIAIIRGIDEDRRNAVDRRVDVLVLIIEYSLLEATNISCVVNLC